MQDSKVVPIRQATRCSRESCIIHFVVWYRHGLISSSIRRNSGRSPPPNEQDVPLPKCPPSCEGQGRANDCIIACPAVPLCSYRWHKWIPPSSMYFRLLPIGSAPELGRWIKQPTTISNQIIVAPWALGSIASANVKIRKIWAPILEKNFIGVIKNNNDNINDDIWLRSPLIELSTRMVLWGAT